MYSVLGYRKTGHAHSRHAKRLLAIAATLAAAFLVLNCYRATRSHTAETFLARKLSSEYSSDWEECYSSDGGGDVQMRQSLANVESSLQQTTQRVDEETQVLLEKRMKIQSLKKQVDDLQRYIGTMKQHEELLDDQVLQLESFKRRLNRYTDSLRKQAEICTKMLDKTMQQIKQRGAETAEVVRRQHVVRQRREEVSMFEHETAEQLNELKQLLSKMKQDEAKLSQYIYDLNLKAFELDVARQLMLEGMRAQERRRRPREILRASDYDYEFDPFSTEHSYAGSDTSSGKSVSLFAINTAPETLRLRHYLHPESRLPTSSRLQHRVESRLHVPSQNPKRHSWTPLLPPSTPFHPEEPLRAQELRQPGINRSLKRRSWVPEDEPSFAADKMQWPNQRWQSEDDLYEARRVQLRGSSSLEDSETVNGSSMAGETSGEEYSESDWRSVASSAREEAITTGKSKNTSEFYKQYGPRNSQGELVFEVGTPLQSFSQAKAFFEAQGRFMHDAEETQV